MHRPWKLCRTAAACGVYLVSACGAPAANQPTESTTVLNRDQFGQVQTQDAPAVDTESPGWLAGIEQGDLLSYRVEVPDAPVRTVQIRVERMVRRGNSAAALLVPVHDSSEATDLTLTPHWLAGDPEGLYELQAHEALLEPGFTPLDETGHVIDSGQDAALFRVPQSWDEVVHHEQTNDVGGWSVEELDLSLDGPVRGDRCARISKKTEGSRVRMTVCANVGMVDLQRGADTEIGEAWELTEIVRVAATP